MNQTEYYRAKLELERRGTFAEVQKSIIYFIMSHAHRETPNGDLSFVWPVIPHPDMGEKFCKKIKIQHDFIAAWINENPLSFNAAVNGYYIV